MAIKVRDILQLKGNAVYTAQADDLLADAVREMEANDVGSIVVLEHGDVVGMLSFREVIRAIVKNGGSLGTMRVRSAMDDAPLTCTMETELDEVRRMILDHHTRYMPVMEKRMLTGVVSLFDVAKVVVESQNFENKLLKAYIRDWPQTDVQDGAPAEVPATAKN